MTAQPATASTTCGACGQHAGCAWFHGALQMYLCDRCGQVALRSMHEIVQFIRDQEGR